MPADASAVRSGPRPWLLVLLGVAVLAAIVSFTWRSATPVVPSSNSGAARQRAQGAAGLTAQALDVGLERLNEPPPQPSDGERNPFQFAPERPAAPAGAPEGGGIGPGARRVRPVAPSGPPAPPPIPLKFIGILDSPAAGKIAALSDGRFVYQGREGDIIDGRYRIVHIGVESIVMEHIDGRGRQTIPMTGQ